MPLPLPFSDRVFHNQYEKNPYNLIGALDYRAPLQLIAFSKKINILKSFRNYFDV